MIAKDNINLWRKSTAAALKELGETDQEATKPYRVTKCGDTDHDLVSLQQMESHLASLGFSDIRLVQGKWWTSYGKIEVRVFVEHGAGKDTAITYTLVAASVSGSDVIEVGTFKVSFEGNQPIVGQLSLNIAALVLPQCD